MKISNYFANLLLYINCSLDLDPIKKYYIQFVYNLVQVIG